MSMMSGPLIFGFLVVVGVMIGFGAAWRFLQTEDPVEARLREFGVPAASPNVGGTRSTWPLITRLLAGSSFGPGLAASLTRADLSITAAEFVVITLSTAIVAFVIGALQGGLLLGLPLGALGFFLPLFYVRLRSGRRRRSFMHQVPEMLTLLVGALRAGFGLSQALDSVAEQMAPPASTELVRVMRAVELGQSIGQALIEMAERVGLDELDLVVTAINVQYEMGGNLAQTLEIIGETVRDRIRMLRQIRVLTAQQRLTGYVLSVLPPAVGFMFYLINPSYMLRLFQPGWIRLLPAAAVVMQIVGFLVIRRIVDIEV
jgi:tight adherence protein B